MAASVPVVAIPVVDTSDSMIMHDYVAITVIDTKAFISHALAGDYIGVASYDVAGKVSYNLTLVDANLNVPKEATNAVGNLSFRGWRTNMGGGLQTAVNMLSSAPTAIPRGLVLLSDGHQNHGTPPIPLPSGCPPVYSCAMGPDSDLALMQQIATDSKGKYYYAPYVWDMMTIYNQIRGQTPQSHLLANSYKNASPYDFLLIPATISAGNDLGQFSAVWSDAAVQFVNGRPGNNQISVTLVNPNGTTLTPTPTLQGGGYVVFNIPNPQPGQWYIQIMYGGTKPQAITGGAFEYSPSGNAAPVNLTVEHSATVKAGEPIHYSISLTDDEKAIPNQHIRATITKPRYGITTALSRYSDLLKNVALPADATDGVDGPDRVKLNHLYHSKLPSEDLLPHDSYLAIPQQAGDGKYNGTITETLEEGTYNVLLEVTGYAPNSGTPFSRSHLFSVLVQR